MDKKKILLIEPFYVGSHKVWADSLVKHSIHDITLLTLPGKHWKWRMHGAAITLANEFLKRTDHLDVILVTDMLDSTTFISLTRHKLKDVTIGIYFHESQFTYPKSNDDTDLSKGRDNHYGFINYTSALAADKLFFNSKYHKHTFLHSVDEMLNRFPDHKNLETGSFLKQKSEVLYVGLELGDCPISKQSKPSDRLRVLWNHRWEHDKNLIEFLQIMIYLTEHKANTEIVLLGQPAKLSKAEKALLDRLERNIIHQGYIESWEEYINLLRSCHILPVTSNQEFFGISVAEAIYYGVTPYLPNRLSYPELIPKDQHNRYLYADNETLLQMILDSTLEEEINHKLVNHIAQFKWSHEIKNYDNQFSLM